MSAIILHKLLSLNRNIFQDLSLSMTKFQPSVAYKSVAYKRKSVYSSLFDILFLSLHFFLATTYPSFVSRIDAPLHLLVYDELVKISQLLT